MGEHTAEKDAAYRDGALAAFAEIEAQMSAFTRRGSEASPQWPWHAIDRARTRVLSPAEGREVTT